MNTNKRDMAEPDPSRAPGFIGSPVDVRALAPELASRPGKGFPPLPDVAYYRRRWLGRDLVAGVTFGAVTMPGQLATAHLAGMPPITGLYGFVVETVIAAAVSTNRHLAMG